MMSQTAVWECRSRMGREQGKVQFLGSKMILSLTEMRKSRGVIYFSGMSIEK